MAKREHKASETLDNTTGESVNEVESVNPFVELVNRGFTAKYGDGDGWEIRASEMTVSTLAYLIENGFKQSMSDAAAFSKKDTEGLSDDEIADKARDKRNARFDAILAGTVGTRSGGARKKGLDRYISDIVLEQLKARSAQIGRPFPSGKGAAARIAALQERWLANPTRAESIREAAKVRMEQATQAANELGEDDDIFGEEGDEADAA